MALWKLFVLFFAALAISILNGACGAGAWCGNALHDHSVRAIPGGTNTFFFNPEIPEGEDHIAIPEFPPEEFFEEPDALDDIDMKNI
jgi:hypothetical protein